MKEQIHKFNTLLRQNCWDDVFTLLQTQNDPTEAYNLFVCRYRYFFDMCFPEKYVKSSYRQQPRHEWMTKGLVKSCNRKSKLYKQYRKNNNIENKTKYITYRNKLKTLLYKAERQFYSNKFNLMAGDMRKTWRLINVIIKKNKFDIFIRRGSTGV